MIKNKYTLFILSICLSIIFSCSGQNEMDTPEDLGKKIFESFRKNDFKIFESCFVTVENYENFLKSNNEKITKKKENLVREHLKSLHINLRSIFNEIIENGKDHGIKWVNARFIKVDYKLEQRDSMLQADYIDVILQDGEYQFAIRLDDCAKFSKSWLITDKPFLKQNSSDEK